ncbi:MAG: hypothetical protein H6738_22585 [Alphaproteobacteria bacterium]|nr:hypothetical protein [Alphaproteobacteria bacterium]MCB9699589.1 hypothetical protein [Alphaproteobacteria bacterium]
MTPALLVLGLGGLDVALDEPFRSAAACAGCHPDEVADWERSRHRASWSNELMFEGYVQETRRFCVTCHAPLREQVDEVLANTPFYRSRDPGSGVPPTAMAPEPMASEGVTCVVCHLREGRVLAVDGAGAHRFTDAPELASAELCGSCHQFPVAGFVDGRMVPTDTPMQGTYDEWRRWAEATGDDRVCQDCHLPAGRHLFRGAHDLDWLRSSVRVVREGHELVVSTVDVGHDLPSGDLFRALTLEVDAGHGFVEVARFARSFGEAFDEALGGSVKVLTADTSLRPGVPRRVVVREGARWRLRYHFASELDEVRGRLPLDEIVVTLVEGSSDH